MEMYYNLNFYSCYYLLSAERVWVNLTLNEGIQPFSVVVSIVSPIIKCGICIDDIYSFYRIIKVSRNNEGKWWFT